MYQVHHIRQIVKGQWLQESRPEAPIAHLLLDSRQVLFAKSALFFAIPGKHHDGHDYLEQAYQQGVRNFIVSRRTNTLTPGANIILVDDPLTALQQIATFHRQQFELPCIGITGSNGKTIVKELLFQLLRHQYKIVRSPKSYNSQVGVPLSVWQMEEMHNLGIFEAGISEPGEMERLAPIIDCQIGVFTNIGPAHAEGFESKEEKVYEKLKLFKDCKTIVYCKDKPIIAEALIKKQALIKTKGEQLTTKDKTLFSWSRNTEADLQIKETTTKDTYSRIVGIFRGEEMFLEVPFFDAVYLENVIHCWAVALHLGLSPEYCYMHAKSLESVEMRLELKQGINNCTIINDSYNADLGSLQIALQFLARQQEQKKRTLILSDILQSGQSADGLYEEVARLLSEQQISKLIGIGESIPTIADFLPKGVNTSFYNNTNTFLSQLSPEQFQQETILLKGARQFEFEKIANRLSQKVHRTVLEINLNALSHNLHVYSRYLEAGTKMMVMVKASAYGSGSVEVARLLAFNKVDYLAVAYTDEGINLRKAGIQLPIMVLNPEKRSLEELFRHDLEAQVYNLSLLRSIVALTKNSVEPEAFPARTLKSLKGHQPASEPGSLDSSKGQKKEILIHLKLDTGMNRLGFREGDIDDLTIILQNNPHLKIQSIFSHMAGSETAEHDAFTLSQVERFNGMHNNITSILAYKPMRHLLNSGGIIRFPKQHMEMVRLGIGLYGVD
ncbi:MAG: UDP-N-acetylmuramoyl-tripeptide--D-alanyl-D-alanine ligase, partial [Polaribacter sp.]